MCSIYIPDSLIIDISLQNNLGFYNPSLIKAILLGMKVIINATLIFIFSTSLAANAAERVTILIQNKTNEPSSLYVDSYQDAVHCKKAIDIPVKKNKKTWWKLQRRRYVTLSINGITDDEAEDNEPGCGKFFTFKLPVKAYAKEQYMVTYDYTPLNGECHVNVRQRLANGRYRNVPFVERLGRLNVFKGACRLNELKQLN